MKFIITLITSLILLIPASGQGQWDVLNEGGFFVQIEFVNDHVGWMGTDGKLLKTEDGGETWISIPVETDLWINQIDFINEQIGWYTATYYGPGERHFIISKSYDGGLTWTIQLNRVGRSSRLNAVNDSVVYVAGDSFILKTSDGGMSWMDQTPNLYDFYVSSVWPFNSTNLLVVLFRQELGYSIWQKLAPEFRQQV